MTNPPAKTRQGRPIITGSIAANKILERRRPLFRPRRSPRIFEVMASIAPVCSRLAITLGHHAGNTQIGLLYVQRCRCRGAGFQLFARIDDRFFRRPRYNPAERPGKPNLRRISRRWKISVPRVSGDAPLHFSASSIPTSGIFQQRGVNRHPAAPVPYPLSKTDATPNHKR